MKRLVVLISIIIMVVAGWIVAWFAVAIAIKTRADQFMQASLNAAPQIECKKFIVSGFPFDLVLTCSNLVVRDGDISFSLPRIKAAMQVFSPTSMEISASGPAAIKDDFSGSRRQIGWDYLNVFVRTNGWALDRVSIAAGNLEFIDNLAGEKLLMRIERFKAELADNPDKYNKNAALVQLSALVGANKVTLAEFDLTDASLRLEATIGAIPDDIRQWSLSRLASNWFREKTGIELVAFTGADARSEFKLVGSLSANGQARLSGDFALHTKNIMDRLQRFIDPTTLQILFGFPNKDNSRDQSYSLRHGVLLAGNLPVLTFNALN
ncbi:hypothetical protein MNBD_ALPHA12-634 [hydrothermal vent metagenome]|uniref:DUF2125 domain-containing protein n=1 Tax=hydrothermal vent metagenome TaxID=652676 RepID=A0A3B0TAP5_9ZZZZ